MPEKKEEKKMTENRPTKTYYSEVYEPMRKRELEKANKELLKDIKKFN